MNDWEKRLYDGYVSTEQAANPRHLDDLEHPYNDKLIADHLPSSTDIAIVDLACGHGRLIYSLKKRGYRNVSGVDVSGEQVAVAHRLGITEVQCQDINQFLKGVGEESFDVVFLMDILEHLGKQAIFDLLDNVRRIIKKDGMLVVHVPNGAGIFGMKVRYGDFTHQNAFTQQSMQQILHACNFDAIKCFEDKPVIHGLKSAIRFYLWEIFTLFPRLLLLAETGVSGHLLSQNILVTATRSADSKHAAVTQHSSQLA